MDVKNVIEELHNKPESTLTDDERELRDVTPIYWANESGSDQ